MALQQLPGNVFDRIISRHFAKLHHLRTLILSPPAGSATGTRTFLTVELAAECLLLSRSLWNTWQMCSTRAPCSRVLAAVAFPLFWLLNLRVALLSGAYHTGSSLPGFLLCIQFLFLFTSHLADGEAKSSFLKSCFLWTAHSWVMFLSYTLCL